MLCVAGARVNCQPRYDFVQRGVRSRLYFDGRLVLDGMRHVNGVKVRPAESGSLGSGRQHELVRRYGYCGDSPILKPDRVVQTARCARPSIGQRFDYGIQAAQFFQQWLRGRFRVGGLHFTDDAPNTITIEQQAFETIQKDTASRLADIE